MLESIEFETAVEEACEAATDELEYAARERAVNGVSKAIYYQGDVVGYEQTYSDSLMSLFLQAKRKSQFGSKTEITGAGGKPLTINIRTFEDTSNVQPPIQELIEGVVIATAIPAPEDFV